MISFNKNIFEIFKMKYLLVIVLFFVFLIKAVNAKGYYLILEKKGTGLERIKMESKEECAKLGGQWSQVSHRHKFVCLENKEGINN